MLTFRSNYPALIFILIIAFSFYSCEDDDPVQPNNNDKGLKIAVFSDPHLYDMSLGSGGQAFEEDLIKEVKMFNESEAILDATVNSIIAEKPDIVLIPGDLTKDGEKINHDKILPYLRKIENSGIKVYVTPGNHDINSKEAFSYSGANRTPVETISSDRFVQLYDDFGFKEAIKKDQYSLSYIAEPKKGIWLLVIDACKYKENTNVTVHSGKICTETQSWITANLKEAKEKNIRVFAMMHHGLMEHFTGQRQFPLTSQYVLDDWEIVSDKLATEGLEVIFTGHGHANDITKRQSGDKSIYDIETMSIVSYPSGYRMAVYDGESKLSIVSKFIENINYQMDKPFKEYNENFIKAKMTIFFTQALREMGLEDENVVNTSVAAYMNFWKGDEAPPSTEQQAIITALKGNSQTAFFGSILESAFYDINTPDNNVDIPLTEIK